MGEDDRVVVWISHKDARCATCGSDLAQGDFIAMDRARGIRCLKCADLGELVFLPSGDAALTRRALAASERSAVVVKFSRARRRNERQGALVEERALAVALEANARDQGARETRRRRRLLRDEVAEKRYLTEFAARIRELFPRAPPGEADAIARRACERYSGRVGRSAAAKALAPEAIALAVRAHVRHAHTAYERLVAEGREPAEARALVRPAIERVLARWRVTG